jgi:hypothetical protein
VNLWDSPSIAQVLAMPIPWWAWVVGLSCLAIWVWDRKKED